MARLRFCTARDGAVAASMDEYRCAFTDDATITVSPLGSATPLQSTNNIPDFVNENTTSASAFAINPHFILNSDLNNPDVATRGMDLMNMRYEHAAERQETGEWRIVDMTIYFDEIFNDVVFFGAGQTPS